MHDMRPLCLPLAVQNGAVEWEVYEDELLGAVAHEFGTNWQLVADVLAGASSLSGFLRTSKACRERYSILTVSGMECHKPYMCDHQDCNMQGGQHLVSSGTSPVLAHFLVVPCVTMSIFFSGLSARMLGQRSRLANNKLQGPANSSQPR